MRRDVFDDRFMPQIEPECVVPAQWFEPEKAKTGERRLLLALLDDALGVLAKKAPHLIAHVEAIEWFESERDSWGSMLFIADELGITPSGLRIYARRLIDSKVSHVRIHRVSGTRTNLARARRRRA